MSDQVRRIAVVTGANKGIGYYIALQLAGSGIFTDVIMACRDEMRGKQAVMDVRQELQNSNEKMNACQVAYLPLIVGNRESHVQFRDMLLDQYDGVLHVLVNNAAIAFKGNDPTPFADQTQPTLDVNFRGTADITELLLPLLRRGTDSRIINIASMAGYLSQLRSEELRKEFTSTALTMNKLHSLVDQFQSDVRNGVHVQKGWGTSNYGFSKLALIAATKVWAREEAVHGVKVNCCCPGYCDTDMTSHRGTIHPKDGAKNAVLLATMNDCPTGEFIQNMKISSW